MKNIISFYLLLSLYSIACKSEIFFLEADNNQTHNEIARMMNNTHNNTLMNDIFHQKDLERMAEHYIRDAEVFFGFWISLLQSFIMLVVAEIADKTFILILLFASKSNRDFVFFSSTVSLLTFNMFSIIVGYSSDMLLYKRFIDWLALILIIVIGFGAIKESFEMSSKTLEDNYIIQLKIEKKKENNTLADPLIQIVPDNVVSWKLFWIIFSTLVVAECGDKSQFTTILISAVFDIRGVILGTSLAFILCNLLNIYAGHKLAKYLREKQLHFFCGFVLIVYGLEILLRKFKLI